MSKIDVGALAGDFALDVTDRVAAALTTAATSCDGTGIPLNDLQVARLTQEMLRHFDGLELGFVRGLLRTLESAGIETWGLSREHETVLGRG